MTHQEWKAEGVHRFGADPMKWKFICPACGHIQSVKDYKDAGAPQGAIGFSCVGRYMDAKPRDAFEKGPGPCNYAGGGLFGLNPLDVDGVNYFNFAEATQCQPNP